MTQLAADDFNRANGSVGANWAAITGETGIAFIVSNEATNNGAGTFGSRYTATAAPNDGYAEITVGSTVSTTSDEGVGPGYRVAAGARTMYFAQTNTVETKLYIVNSGAFTQLGVDGAACAAGDTLKITCSGTSISVQRNGSTIIGPVTNATIASGSAGIWVSSVGNGTINAFALGDLASAAGVLLPWQRGALGPMVVS